MLSPFSVRPASASSLRERFTQFSRGALAPQHRPEIAYGQISGIRAFDPQVSRRDFPILAQRVNGRPLIWLDNGATTQKPQAVIDRIVRFYTEENSNVHRAAHTLAARASDAYEAAREKVRGFINAPSPRDIIFVRGATEGINLVAQSWGRRNVGQGDEIVITHLEHHADIVPWRQLALGININNDLAGSDSAFDCGMSLPVWLDGRYRKGEAEGENPECRACSVRSGGR
jgi:cysteine desulfurase/selenocysteine lyase